MDCSSYFLEMMGMSDRAQEMKTFLWVSCRSGLINSDQQSAILRRLFVQGGCPPLGLRDFRQVSVAVCDAYLRQVLQDEDDEVHDIMALQRNHSSQTANLAYGGTSGHKIDRRTEHQFMCASEQLHRFWEVSDPTPYSALDGIDLNHVN